MDEPFECSGIHLSLFPCHFQEFLARGSSRFSYLRWFRIYLGAQQFWPLFSLTRQHEIRTYIYFRVIISPKYYVLPLTICNRQLFSLF